MRIGVGRELIMRILLVEDDPRTADDVVALLNVVAGVRVVTCSDQATALESFSPDAFDLVLCDVWIPPSQGESASSDTGYDLADRLATAAPFVPVWFLTGEAWQREGMRRAEAGREISLGREQLPTRRYMSKDHADEMRERVRELAEALRALDEFDAIPAPGDEPVSRERHRLVASFALIRGATRIRYTALPGGYTEAQTLQAQLQRGEHYIGQAFLKLDSFADSNSECVAYDEIAEGRLPLGSYPSRMAVLGGGGRGQQLVAYQLAEESQPLFRLGLSDDSVSNAISAIPEVCKSWAESRSTQRIVVRDLIQQRLGRTDLAEVWPSDLDGMMHVLDQEILIYEAEQHGDLHGANVFVRPSSDVILIDFAEAGRHSSVLDPVMLELGFIFHESTPLDGSWPTLQQALRWYDLEVYLDNCPLSRSIGALREWCSLWAKGEDQVCATVAAQAVRQLKYPDADKSLAIGFTRGALSRLDSG